METLALLKALSEVHGPSGREQPVADLIKTWWTPYADDIRADALGSLIALQRGNAPAPRPAVMLAAHMDEIALVVTGIEGEFLRITSLSGMDRRVVLGLEVLVHGARPLSGIVGTRPPHVLPPAERDKVLPWDKLFVDVGLPADEVKKLVRVGDSITMTGDLLELKNGLVAGKALDNRASVAVVTLALASLRERVHAWDVYAVATVQEEVGVKGAITSAYGLSPQMAVALDVTFAKQHDDSDTGTFKLNTGPTIGIGPNFHPQVVEKLEKAAKAEEIPYTLEPAPGHSGTDAWGIQVAREGVPTGLLGLPLRYMHQPVETGCLRDLERAARLLTGFVTRLTAEDSPRWEDEA